MRSILVPDVFVEATSVQIGLENNILALTLMSTDMERIRNGLRTIHETWACIVQAGIASWLLYQPGIVFVVPLAVIGCCTISLGILMRCIAGAQRLWMARVQKRVGLAATVIASMKNLKLSGLTTTIEDFVQGLRLQELSAASRFRIVLMTAALMGFTRMLISPPLTLAFARGALTASTIFTSLTFIALLTGPLTDVFENIPRIVSAFACLGRIRGFLQCQDRVDVGHIRETTEVVEDGEVECMNPSSLKIAIRNGAYGWEDNKAVL